MSEENNTGAVSQLKIEEDMQIAYLTDITLIAKIIPWLTYRQEAAKRYIDHGNKLSDEARLNLIEMVRHCNKEIKIIMGL